MDRKNWIFSIVIIVSFQFYLASCDTEEIKNVHKLVDSIPAKNLKSYSFDPRTSLASRIKPVPEFVLDYLKIADSTDLYSPYIPSEEDIALVEEYIMKLPNLHQKILQERLIGIYFVDNFIGSGVIDCVFDERANVYAIFTFNSDTVKRNISEWLTFRENTCFIKNSPDFKIEINCGNEFKGLMYILLHESSHLVDYVRNYTPYADESITKFRKTAAEERPFVEEIWEGFDRPLPDHDSWWMSKVSFYGLNGGPTINISDALTIYSEFSNTPFVSLYGTMNWGDDFAEYITFYHLTAELNQPYEIKYLKEEQVVYIYSPLESAKVQKRLPYLRGIYQHRSSAICGR